MSSPSPKPTIQEGASKSPKSDEVQPESTEKRAVETFAFEVSAGSTPDVELPQSAPDRLKEELPEPGDELRVQEADEPQVEPSPAPTAMAPDSVLPASVLPAVVRIEAADDQSEPKANVARRVARQSSWWMTSLGVHVILLLALAFSTLAIIQEEELELYATAAVYEPVEEFQDLEIDPTDDLESLDEELSEPDPAPLEDLSSELLVEEPAITEQAISDAPATELTESFSELGGLMGDLSTDSGGMDSAIGTGTGEGMAKFFGTEVKARRILYMLDNSGGMRKNGKFEALVDELKKSVSSLDAKQEFYVIFYSDTVYPLFYPQGVRKFVRSNDRNRNLLDRWLASVELCGGNAIDEALAAAEIIRPETVFLLTDGDLFTTDKKKALLLNPNGRSYSIHTFGLGVGETTKTAERLRQVADANAGTFRAIKVTDAMEALAKEIQRPYHSKAPGDVWGLKVGTR